MSQENELTVIYQAENQKKKGSEEKKTQKKLNNQYTQRLETVLQ